MRDPVCLFYVLLALTLSNADPASELLSPDAAALIEKPTGSATFCGIPAAVDWLAWEHAALMKVVICMVQTKAGRSTTSSRALH